MQSRSKDGFGTGLIACLHAVARQTQYVCNAQAEAPSTSPLGLADAVLVAGRKSAGSGGIAHAGCQKRTVSRTDDMWALAPEHRRR